MTNIAIFWTTISETLTGGLHNPFEGKMCSLTLKQVKEQKLLGRITMSNNYNERRVKRQQLLTKLQN